MKHLLAVALAAVALSAQAQHVHPPAAPASGTIKVPKTQDPDNREHWPGAAITPAPGESVDHASQHALPLGTGASPDGSAWLRPDVTGIYVLHNVELNELKALNVKPPFHVMLRAGQLYRIQPHKGPAVWTKPDQTREAIPKENLIPTMTVKSNPGRPYP